MRNRCRGKYSPAVASVIVRNYSRLMERLCASQSGPVQGAMDDADIMQETFLHVTHDPQCTAMKNEAEILARFVFRYRLVRFRHFGTRHSAKQFLMPITSGWWNAMRTDRDAARLKIR